MAFTQINVDDGVKTRCDAAYARHGMTTPGAMKVLAYETALSGCTPFDGMSAYLGEDGSYADDLRRDIVAAWACEFGLLESHSAGRDVPLDVLEELGIAPDEVRQ